MVDITPTISVNTLNVNSLNEPIKRQRLSECIPKQDLTIHLQETHFKYKHIKKLKVNEWKKKTS